MNGPPQSPYLLRRGRQRRLLLLCDHAGNRVPQELDGLGLDPAQRQRHIAWDPGALGVARRLAEAFDCDLMACMDSRLLADPNRAPEHADLILAQSDGIFVPGNECLDGDARAARLARFHTPYHAAIAAELDARRAAGAEPFLLSIHSFEPVFAGIKRPWPVGVLWKVDDRLARQLCEQLARHTAPVGLNQPYDGRAAIGYTLDTHAIGRGLPHLLIELRNDGLRDAAARAQWASVLSQALAPVLAAWLDAPCAAAAML